VRFVRYEPAPIAERLPQTRPDSPSASDNYAAGRETAAEPSRLSMTDLAAL
jgi:hypothetical protein